MQAALQLGSISSICELVGSGANDLQNKLETVVLTEDWLQAFLTQDEVIGLNRLSVFAGSFDASGAAAVAPSAGKVLCQHVLH